MQRRQPSVRRSAQSGNIVIVVVISALVVAVVGGLGTLLFKRELAAVRSQSAAGGRTALATILNSYITNPAILHASLFNTTCVQDKLASEHPPINSSTSPCLVSNELAAAAGFTPFVLQTPSGPGGTGIQLTGTAMAPIRYTVDGNICNTPSDYCAYEVFTSARTNGVSVIENGIVKPAIRIRYVIRNQNQVSSGESIAAYTFQGEATMPIEKFNRRNNPTEIPACKDVSGAITNDLRGKIQLGAIKNVAWPANERPVCVAGIGTRVCPGTRFQVGLNAAGDPICLGSRAVCPPGRVQYGYEPAPDGGVRPRCVLADCRDRNGRFGFVRPTAADDLSNGVGCLPVAPKAGCENRIKTTINHAGDLGC